MEYTAPVGAADPNDPYITGNPGTGTVGSAVPGEAVENPQRELDHLISFAGLVPSNGDLQQVRKAIQALLGIQSFATAPGELSNNVSFPTTQLDIVAGTWRAESAAANIVLPATTIDISVVGDGGILGSDTRDPDTWYHVLSGKKTSDGSFVAGFSKTYGNPGGWDFFRRHGSWRTDSVASPNSGLRKGLQWGDWFFDDDPQNEPTVTGDATNTLTFVPPDVRVLARVALFGQSAAASGASNFGSMLRPLDFVSTAKAPAFNNPSLTSWGAHMQGSGVNNQSIGGVTMVDVLTDTSQQVRLDVTNVAAPDLSVHGYMDLRGRNLS